MKLESSEACLPICTAYSNIYHLIRIRDVYTHYTRELIAGHCVRNQIV